MRRLTDFLIDEKQWLCLSLVSVIQELIDLLMDEILREIGSKFCLSLAYAGVARFSN